VRNGFVLPDLGSHEQIRVPPNTRAAGTALPNLAVRASAGRVVDEKIFDLASELSARTRRLAPDDADIQGPMPLIKYFAAQIESGHR